MCNKKREKAPRHALIGSVITHDLQSYSIVYDSLSKVAAIPIDQVASIAT